MSNSVFQKKTIIAVLLMLAGCMVIGSFFDYQISSAIFNPNSFFGIFFASYGQLPAMLCFSIGGCLLIKIANKKHLVSFVLSYVFGILLTAFAILGIAMDPMLYIPNMSLPISVVIALVLVVVCDYLVLKYSKEAKREDVKKVIIAFIGIMFVEIMLINIIKIPWGRPRMRMISVTPEASFQPWWVIGSEMKDKLVALGVAAEEFKSFPSGHTGNAACAMLLGILPIICTSLKGKEKTLFISGFVFTLVVAFSRLVMGAHFLTDVTVGMTITFIVEVIFVYFLFGKKHK